MNYDIIARYFRWLAVADSLTGSLKIFLKIRIIPIDKLKIPWYNSLVNKKCS